MATPLLNNGDREKQTSERSDQIELPPSIDMTLSSNKPTEETNGQKDNTARHIQVGLINPGPEIGSWEHYKRNPLDYFNKSFHHVLKKEANAPPGINCYHSYETTQENATTQPKLPLQLDSKNSSHKTYVYRSFLTTYKKKNYFKF
uniref:Uncharacterized protein n=1 Tax=Amphimedon queenslandica TaxID=400682 RepID=A0A1X7UXF1_AMPQE